MYHIQERVKNGKISFKNMHFKISLYRAFNVSRKKMILAKFHYETTQSMSLKIAAH